MQPKRLLTLSLRIARLSLLGIIIWRRVRPFIPYIRFALKTRHDVSRAMSEIRQIVNPSSRPTSDQQGE